jgi:hypothetical protein
MEPSSATSIESPSTPIAEVRGGTATVSPANRVQKPKRRGPIGSSHGSISVWKAEGRQMPEMSVFSAKQDPSDTAGNSMQKIPDGSSNFVYSNYAFIADSNSSQGKLSCLEKQNLTDISLSGPECPDA